MSVAASLLSRSGAEMSAATSRPSRPGAVGSAEATLLPSLVPLTGLEFARKFARPEGKVDRSGVRHVGVDAVGAVCAALLDPRSPAEMRQILEIETGPPSLSLVCGSPGMLRSILDLGRCSAAASGARSFCCFTAGAASPSCWKPSPARTTRGAGSVDRGWRRVVMCGPPATPSLS